MATNNPYLALVDGFARLLNEGAAFGPAALIPPERPTILTKRLLSAGCRCGCCESKC